MTDENELYKRAREQVEAQKGFYVHLLIYLLVNAGLLLINLATRGRAGSWWFYWPLLGWGIGLAAHCFSVFGAFGLFTRKWEERQIEKIVTRERSRQDQPK